MRVIAFEQDPLVKEDIRETLEANVSGGAVAFCDDLQDLTAEMSRGDAPQVAIISVPDGIEPVTLDNVLNVETVSGCVLIANSPEDAFRLPPNSFYIQRPFGSELLEHAVKTVLSALPEARP